MELAETKKSQEDLERESLIKELKEFRAKREIYQKTPRKFDKLKGEGDKALFYPVDDKDDESSDDAYLDVSETDSDNAAGIELLSQKTAVVSRQGFSTKSVSGANKANGKSGRTPSVAGQT